MDYEKKILEIQEMKADMDKIYMDICRTDSEKAYQALSKVITSIAAMVTEFIENSQIFIQYGIEVPKEILLEQLQNLLDGFQNRDYIMIADTLHYEISDSLQFYIEILEAFQKENIAIGG